MSSFIFCNEGFVKLDDIENFYIYYSDGSIDNKNYSLIIKTKNNKYTVDDYLDLKQVLYMQKQLLNILGNEIRIEMADVGGENE